MKGEPVMAPTTGARPKNTGEKSQGGKEGGVNESFPYYKKGSRIPSEGDRGAQKKKKYITVIRTGHGARKPCYLEGHGHQMG